MNQSIWDTDILEGLLRTVCNQLTSFVPRYLQSCTNTAGNRISIRNAEVRILSSQPASVRFREFPSRALERPTNCGLFAMAKISELPLVELWAAIFPKVSTQHQ